MFQGTDECIDASCCHFRASGTHRAPRRWKCTRAYGFAVRSGRDRQGSAGRGTGFWRSARDRGRRKWRCRWRGRCTVRGRNRRSTVGKVLWCVTRPDLFAPAIEQAGLPPGRVIYVEAGDEKSVLACFEEGLRGGSGAVVAEIARLSMTASRRLQLAAESSGAIGIAIRRWRRQTEATDFGQPAAAATRWRVSVLLSTPLPVPGVGRARWQLELIRCRAGESADFIVEPCDAKGRIALPSVVANRPLQKEIGRRRVSA